MFPKKWLCFCQKCFFFQFFFSFSKIKVLLDLFFLIGFSFNKDVFSEKEKIFLQRVVSLKMGGFLSTESFLKNELLFPRDDFFQRFFFFRRGILFCVRVFFFQTFFKSFFFQTFFKDFLKVFAELFFRSFLSEFFLHVFFV